MPESLLDPSIQELDEEVRERLSELSEELRQEEQDLFIEQRRDACKYARELAENDPKAARHLAPLLVEVIREEIDRSYSNAAAEIIKIGPSRETQIEATKALAECASPQHVELNHQSEISPELLARLWELVVTNSQSHTARVSATKALSELIWHFPEIFSEYDGTQHLVESIGTLIRNEDRYRSNSDQTSKEFQLAAIRILTFLAVQNSETFPITSTVQRSLLIADQSDDRRCRSLATLVREVTEGSSQSSWSAAASGQQSIDVLIDEVHSKLRNDFRQNGAAGALGELVMVVPDKFEQIPQSLVDDVRIGKLSTKALGKLIAVASNHNDHPPQFLIDRIRNSGGFRRREAARVIGMWAAAHPNRFNEPPTELIDESNAEAGRVSVPGVNKWVALGEWVAVDSERADPSLHSIIEHVRDSPYNVRAQTTYALGKAVATSQDSIENAPEEFVKIVRESEEDVRLRVTRALGEVLAVAEDPTEPTLIQLVNKVNNSSDQERRYALEALGWWILTVPSNDHVLDVNTINDIHDIVDRWLAAQTIGEIVTATAEFTGTLAGSLVKRITTSKDSKRRSAAMALGVLAATGGDHIEVPQRAPIEWVRNAGWDKRRTGAEHIGEAIAFQFDADSTLPPLLIKRIRNNRGNERANWAGKLGEIVEISAKDVEEAPDALFDRVHGTTGNDRWLATRALGEWVVASRENSDSVVDQLVKEVHEIKEEGYEEDIIAHLETLGEIIATTNSTIEGIPQAYIDHVRDTSGPQRFVATRALGEAVVAAVIDAGTPLQSIINRAKNNYSTNEQLALEAIGEWVTATPTCFDIPVPKAEDEIDENSELEWSSLMIGLGKLVSSENPTTAIGFLIRKTSKRSGNLNGNGHYCKIIRIIAETGIVGSDEFLTAISRNNSVSDDSDYDITTYLEYEEPSRHQLLITLSTVIEKEFKSKRFPAVRSQLETFLTEFNSKIPTKTRLVAVNVLSQLDEETGLTV